MLSGNDGTNLKAAQRLSTQQAAYQNGLGDGFGKQSDLLKFGKKSSLNASAKASNQIVSTRKSSANTTFNTWSATQNTGLATRSLRSSGGAATNAPRKWNASFLNRTSSNVSDYNAYDFSRPAATLDLGSRGSTLTTAAQLKIDFGNARPTSGVQSDNFAMQAWTRVKLKEGRYYKLSSDSNDGTRFFFKSRETGEVLTALNGDWRDRSTSDAEWSQVLSVPKGGKYDFYVQYYEKSGRSAINVKLEETTQTGRVTSATGLNLRQQPSVTGNTPLRLLNQNETFAIRRQVKSTDANIPDWYEVTTRNGQRGFVVAQSGLSEVVNNGSLAVLGGGLINNPPNTPNPPGGGSLSKPSKGVVKGSSIGFRSSASTSALSSADLSKDTAVTILDKVSGSTYYVNGVDYDQWYKVTTSSGQTGYVAAYYVKQTDGTRYSSALNSSNTLYNSHLAEANPYKTALTQAASPYSWLKPSILAGIGSRESGWGLLLVNGTGDGGHGRGIMQIDDRYHQDFINNNNWRDPGVNIKYAVDNVLADYYNQLSRQTNLTGFDLLRGAIAAYNTGVGGVMDAYNAGLDVDYYTTDGDYSWDVIQRAGWFQDQGWT
jgi:hypothetical protein